MTSRFHWNQVVGAVALAALCFTAPKAHAAVDPDKLLYVFEAIDDVGSGTNVGYVLFSGLEQGASEPIEELRIPFEESVAARCERYGLLMMERPGRYLLELRRKTFALTRWTCRLRVRVE